MCWPILLGSQKPLVFTGKHGKPKICETGSSFMLHLQRKMFHPWFHHEFWLLRIPGRLEVGQMSYQSRGFKFWVPAGTCPKGPFLVPRAIHKLTEDRPVRLLKYQHFWEILVTCVFLFVNQPWILDIYQGESHCYLEWSKHHGRLCCFCEMRQHPISLWFRDLRM